MNAEQENIQDRIRLTRSIQSYGLYWITDVTSLDKENAKATLEAEYSYDVSFAHLAEVAELFGTKNINIGKERRSDGYCSTCYFSYNVPLLYVADITIWPKDLVESND